MKTIVVYGQGKVGKTTMMLQMGWNHGEPFEIDGKDFVAYDWMRLEDENIVPDLRIEMFGMDDPQTLRMEYPPPSDMFVPINHRKSGKEFHGQVTALLWPSE